MLTLDSFDWGLGAVLFALLFAAAATAGAVRRQARRVDRLEDAAGEIRWRVETLEYRADRAEDPYPSDQYPAIPTLLWRQEV